MSCVWLSNCVHCSKRTWAPPVDPEVVCTDACMTGGTGVHCSKRPEEVRELFRTAGSWASALQAPAPSFFLSPGWKVGLRCQFTRAAHITCLESRVVGLAVQRAVRKRSRRKKRCLYFGDNQASLGSMRKRRSSSWGLLVPCRRVAACSLFAGLRLVHRYVPTDRNGADAPSRGKRRPGVVGKPDEASALAGPAESCGPVACGAGARRAAVGSRSSWAQGSVPMHAFVGDPAGGHDPGDRARAVRAGEPGAGPSASGRCGFLPFNRLRQSGNAPVCCATRSRLVVVRVLGRCDPSVVRSIRPVMRLINGAHWPSLRIGIQLVLQRHI